MSNGEHDPWLFHTLWNGVLTALGGLVMFFGKRTLDGKADRGETEARFTEVQRQLSLLLSLKEQSDARQEEQHAENTRRLDRILIAVAGKSGRSA